MNCRLCYSTLSINNASCYYCGYNNQAIFTDDADDSYDYRKRILSKFSAFSLTVNSYKESFESNMSDVHSVTKPLFDNSVTGIEMDRTILTSPVWLEQNDDKQVSLDINYKFGGIAKSVHAAVISTHNEVWYVGLQIDEKLHLIVYLGSSASKSIPLELLESPEAQGDAFAQYNLGCIYEEGLGVEVNYEEAIKWFKLSASLTEMLWETLI